MRGKIGGIAVIEPSVLALKCDRGARAWVNEDRTRDAFTGH
jgi:hypothetical protein